MRSICRIEKDGRVVYAYDGVMNPYEGPLTIGEILADTTGTARPILQDVFASLHAYESNAARNQSEAAMISPKLEVLVRVSAERRRQDDMWGEQNHTMDKWLTILGEEFGEVCQAIGETVLPNRSKPDMGGYDNIMRELTHLAAVSVAMMECMERNRERWGM